MTAREFNDRLLKRVRKAGLSLDPQLVEPLAAYYHLLEFWNQKVNLTAFSLIDAPDEAIDRLLIEPLVAAKHLLGAHTTVTAVLQLTSTSQGARHRFRRRIAGDSR